MEMMKIKKDWLYNQDNAGIKMEYVLIICGIIVLLAKVFMDSRAVKILASAYNGAFLMIMFMVFLYPLTILIGMLPQISTVKPYMNIGSLPISKKKLFMMSLKSTGLKMLGLLGIAFIINIFVYYGGSIEETFNYQVSKAFETLLLSIIIFFQIFIISILYFVKGVSGKKATFIILGIDIIVLTILFMIRLNTGLVNFSLMVGVPFFIGSFIGFLKYWDDIERICN